MLDFSFKIDVDIRFIKRLNDLKHDILILNRTRERNIEELFIVHIEFLSKEKHQEITLLNDSVFISELNSLMRDITVELFRTKKTKRSGTLNRKCTAI